VGGTDEIKFVAVGWFANLGTSVSGEASLAAAITAAFTPADPNGSGAADSTYVEAYQFVWNSATYFVVEATAGGNGAGALVVNVTGLTGTAGIGDFIA